MQFDGRARVSSRIDLAPLIDVVFLLLIFFLLTSSFVSHRAIELNLPTSSSAQTAPELPIVVSIHADGSVHLGDQRIAATTLAAAISTRISETSSRDIAVQADSDVGIQPLLTVLDAIRQGGGENVSLIAEPVATP
jgi:biopolymer transport protein ExbD